MTQDSSIPTDSPLSVRRWITPHRLRLYPPVILLAIVSVYLYHAASARHWVMNDGRIIGEDYLAFFMAGEMARNGDTNDLFSFAAQDQWQRSFMADINPDWKGTCLYLNPPHYAWLMSALTRFGYGDSVIIWWVLSLAAFALTVLIWRKWLAPPAWRTALLLTICLPAWFWALAGGQNSFFSLLILTGFCSLLMGGRDLRAGLVLSLLGYKFQLLLLPAALLLWKRRWRACIGLVAGGIATLGATMLLLGPDVISRYLHFGSQLSGLLQIDGFEVYKQHSWYGMFAALGRGQIPVVSIRVLALTACAVTAILLADIWRGTWQAGTRTFSAQLSALIMATLLTSPHLFHYDLIIATLPVVLWLKARTASPQSQWLPIPDNNSDPFVTLAALGFVWIAVSPLVTKLTNIQLSPVFMLLWLVATGRQLGSFSWRRAKWATTVM